ncbi:HNH endonuclease signature motif containing protein [Nocardia acidivorans]|uniref:HNH endonuclease signature motif containing protein n=1 Tax=Nocardia acidivorans TaxID=404580 RepID=UPI000AEE1B08|nr:HNH endonuclease signature motif containing protein [Nocardia acidivorans]
MDGAHALVAAVHTLCEESLYPLTDDEFAEMMAEVEGAMRRLETVKHRFVADTERRSLADQAGFRKTHIYFERTLRLSHAEALARVRAAERLSPQISKQGEDLGPALPYVAAAQREGAISADHARRIAWIIKRLPEITTDAERENAERILTEYACEGSPDVLPGLGEEIMCRIDPDGTLTTEKDRQRRRGITLGKQRVDGMSELAGEITPELRAVLEALLAKFARPGMCNPEDPESPCTATAADDIDALAAAAQRDTRTSAQRNHDALLGFLRFDVDSTQLGTHRGLPVAAMITMTIDEVERAAGVATTATGGTVSIPAALKLAEGSRPWLAIFDGAGLPLHLGRGRRLASPAQRLALIAAEKGCTRPGCSAPASLAAVHHVTEYAKMGATDIENLTLACDSCHALIHDGPGGWKTVKLPSDHRFPGRTGWIAPPAVDSTGTPKVNQRHHIGEQLAIELAKIHVRDAIAAKRHRARLCPRAPSRTNH